MERYLLPAYEIYLCIRADTFSQVNLFSRAAIFHNAQRLTSLCAFTFPLNKKVECALIIIYNLFKFQYCVTRRYNKVSFVVLRRSAQIYKFCVSTRMMHHQPVATWDQFRYSTRLQLRPFPYLHNSPFRILLFSTALFEIV